MSVAGLLWPEPARVRLVRRPVRRSPRPVREWLVLPGPARPRLLVPVGMPSAARMLTRHGSRLGPRAARALLAAGVRSGLLDRLPLVRIRVDQPVGHAESLERHLGQVLACEVVSGVLLGTPRMNRKPVLQLFDPHGRTVAFVKAGHNARTAALVQGEATNLLEIAAAGLDTIEVPRVLHTGRFGALEVLVLSPLLSSQHERSAAAPPPPLRAMCELAEVAGVHSALLRDSTFAARLEAAVRRVEHPEWQGRLARAVTRVLEQQGGRVVAFGSWHGDWAPWNMGQRDGRVQLWDWERFATGVPLGFDAVHYRAQQVRQDRPALRLAEDALVAELPVLLAEFGLPPQQAELTLVLYLLEIGCRYLAPEGAGPSSGHPRARWALDLVDRLSG